MEKPRNRYILLQDRVGNIIERNMLVLGLSTKSTPTQVLKGELLEALPEAEQPNDSTRIALAGIDRKTLRLECSMEDIARLTSEDADLLLAISSVGLRYEIYIDRKRLDFGRRIRAGSQVSVEVKGISKKLHGAVWYVGELPPNIGTMFGVQLIKNPGLGTSNGTFRNRQYFTCPQDSGVFVGLDKLTPLEDSDLKSPPKSSKRNKSAQPNFVSRLKDTVVPSFLKGKNDQRLKRTDYKLLIGQRVVAFTDGAPIRGIVRYIGEEKNLNGQVHTIVGLELDKRCGSGTGKLKGKQLFIAKRDHAAFVDMETVIPEKDFDENTGETATSQNEEDLVLEQIHKDEIVARSMSYDHGRPSGISALQSEIEHLKRQKSSQSSTSFTTTPAEKPISEKRLKSTCTPSPPSPISCSFENSCDNSNGSVEIEGQVQKEFTVTSPEQSKIAVIPHHLKSKAAGANSLKKGARILAVGLFTVKERCCCTVSGSTNKSKQDNKRPQFEPHRMALIHEFLQKTYPKTYQYPEVNRIVGQVAIESRQGRHSSDDSVVLSLLQ